MPWKWFWCWSSGGIVMIKVLDAPVANTVEGLKVLAIILIADFAARSRQKKSKSGFQTNQSEAGRTAAFFLFPFSSSRLRTLLQHLIQNMVLTKHMFDLHWHFLEAAIWPFFKSGKERPKERVEILTSCYFAYNPLNHLYCKHYL